MGSIAANKLLNPRLIAILFLGFASGLPLALTGSTLQAWFTEEQVNLVTIGTLSLIGMPYALKFLWAPLMDHFRLPWFGRRQGWIMAMQLGLVISIMLLSLLNPASSASLMAMIGLMVAIFSASQDVVVDAYRTDMLTVEERGLGASYYVFAYRLAALTSGALALVSAVYLGWQVTYQLMAVLMLLSMLATTQFPRESEQSETTGRHVGQTVVAAFKDLMQRDKVVLLLLFVVFYKIGDALALQLMTNFLLHGLGFTLMEVGLAYKTVSFVATILGAFVGGVFLMRWHIYRALLLFGLAQAFSNLMFVVLAMSQKNFLLMTSSIFIENFCGGLSSAALMAFLTSLCHRQYSASQYALLSAIAVIGRVFLGPVAGYMVQNLGWVQFYLWSFVLCFPGLLLLIALKSEVSAHVQPASS